MQILRHSRIAITMEIYIDAPEAATRQALQRLSDQLEGGSAMPTGDDPKAR
jgi:hypothetical protein